MESNNRYSNDDLDIILVKNLKEEIKLKEDFTYHMVNITPKSILNMCNKHIRGHISVEDFKNMSMEVRTQLIYECLYPQFLESLEKKK